MNVLLKFLSLVLLTAVGSFAFADLPSVEQLIEDVRAAGVEIDDVQQGNSSDIYEKIELLIFKRKLLSQNYQDSIQIVNSAGDALEACLDSGNGSCSFNERALQTALEARDEKLAAQSAVDSHIRSLVISYRLSLSKEQNTCQARGIFGI